MEVFMLKTVEAVYDGKVLFPLEPLTLPPNTRVWIVIETPETHNSATSSFLQTARSLQLEGPADWSLNLEQYLYGEQVASNHKDEK
jgi:predicted DNA-binding antitoxin AbrB/MazE fold protein